MKSATLIIKRWMLHANRTTAFQNIIFSVKIHFFFAELLMVLKLILFKKSPYTPQSLCTCKLSILVHLKVCFIKEAQCTNKEHHTEAETKNRRRLGCVSRTVSSFSCISTPLDHSANQSKSYLKVHVECYLQHVLLYGEYSQNPLIA